MKASNLDDRQIESPPDGGPRRITQVPRKGARHWPRWAYCLAGLVAVLLVIRLCLPFAVESYVNRQLNRGHDFGGRISHVDIQLWRGQYRIHAIEIFKKSGSDKT